MNEISCPHCKKKFALDESGLADIVKQVRDQAFEAELKTREEIAQREKESAIKLATSEFNQKLQAELNVKNQEIQTIKANNELILTQTIAEKEKQVSDMKTLVSNADMQQKLKVTEAVLALEKEKDSLQSQIKLKETESLLNESSLKDKYNSELRVKDDIIKLKEEEIARVKDMKMKLSTKMVGESLEQHCENEFNKIRMSAFPNAKFGKDNDSSEGSKGDFIFRENDANGQEIISIMFEMKNESDETSTKKKNVEFLKELAKDRDQKKCEYAVLVSLLEADNEYYNSGIVDVSYVFPKMYVIRPQSFVSIISILRNAALKTLEFKNELANIKSQNVDITKFEDQLDEFRNAFGKNYRIACEKFSVAIDNIDKSIAALQKTKDNLLGSQENLRIANNKAEDLSIKRLTKNNPTMEAKFKSISKNTEDKKNPKS